MSELPASAPRHVIWTLQWNLTRNSGMAFSKAQGIGPLIGIAALLVVAVAGVDEPHADQPHHRASPPGLIAGGAIGNLADRLFRGDGCCTAR